MAFLDNSGDIVLDAVLTELGRKKLAQGNGTFNITKFAVADDEIDYRLFNISNPSGSAYYDLDVNLKTGKNLTLEIYGTEKGTGKREQLVQLRSYTQAKA